jgi:hypothetical protein
MLGDRQHNLAVREKIEVVGIFADVLRQVGS